MKVTPDDYGRRCQFDHFCKLVLYHEAVDYFRERKRQRGWETSFETLPLSELDTLCTIDQYPSDSFIFPAYGCELQISDGLVAAAFASLPQPGQSILILHCVLELTDGEIGAVVGIRQIRPSLQSNTNIRIRRPTGVTAETALSGKAEIWEHIRAIMYRSIPIRAVPTVCHPWEEIPCAWKKSSFTRMTSCMIRQM